MMMLRTKLQTRLLALLLMLSLLLTTALFSSCQTVEPPEGEDTTDAQTTGGQTEAGTNEVVGGKYAKLPNNATLDEKFLPDSVFVGIQPYAIRYEYTAESFSEVECVEITGDYRFPSDDSYSKRHLALKLSVNSKQEILQALDLLLEREDIWYAQPVYLEELYEDDHNLNDELEMTLPNDGVYNDDDSSNNWSLEKIMMPDAWDYTVGSSAITVGIIDSGIDATHPDLDERVNVSMSKTFYGNSSPLVDDIDHGTSVAGIIGAEANNQNDGQGSECVGICWNVQLVSLKVSVMIDGAYAGASKQAVVDAILYATEKGIDVLNYSGGGAYHSELTPLMSDAIENYPGVFVCAAGNGYVDNNNDDDPIYPGNFDFTNLITVSSSTVSDYAFAGAHEGQNSVDIYAPGVDIYTTRKSGENAKVTGTSFAAPHVTGVAALMLSLNPNLTPAQVKAIIMNTVDSPSFYGMSEFGDKCVSGGRLNAYEALHYVAFHLEYHDSFVVSDSRNDALEHDWVCSCGDRLEQRHSHSAETHVGSPVYHRLVCICGDYLTEAHTIKIENVNSIDYHKRSCEECQYTSNASHTWELNYVNPNGAQASAYAIGGGDASIQAIPVYTCSDCGYVSYTTPPDYGYN